MPTSYESAKKMYLNIRNQCGIFGILLPWIALFSAGIAEHPGDDWWHSISATYYLTPALPAVMMPICLVLFNYKGYDKLDNLVANLNALFGVLLVIFPCKVSWIPDGTPVGFFQVPVEISHIIHIISTGLFFMMFAFNSIFLFTKSLPGKPISPKKKIRNRIYRFCGWSTLVLELLLGLKIFGLQIGKLNLFIEALLLTNFGFGWLVKGEFFKFLRSDPVEQPKQS